MHTSENRVQSINLTGQNFVEKMATLVENLDKGTLLEFLHMGEVVVKALLNDADEILFTKDEQTAVELFTIPSEKFIYQNPFKSFAIAREAKGVYNVNVGKAKYQLVEIDEERGAYLETKNVSEQAELQAKFCLALIHQTECSFLQNKQSKIIAMYHA